MSQQKPLVGITLRHEPETERFYLARFYSEAVEAAGGVPVHLALIPEPAYVEAVARRLDGLLLPGSASDVDPLRYGREPHRQLGSVHPLRDETDALALGVAESLGLPLLAICYGMQAWNVHRGGTLIQDIASELPNAVKHEQGAPRERPSHHVTLQSESLLARLAGRENLVVNSHHHQALEVLGAELRATAWSADGLIEAVEDERDGRWGVGVQWHPELGWERDDFSRSLFRSFVEASQSFAARRAEESRALRPELYASE